MRRAAALLALAAFAAACAGPKFASKQAPAWPEALEAGEGAVLFGADLQAPPAPVEGFGGYAAFFFPAGKPGAPAGGWVRMSDRTGKPVDDIFLLALPAGAYSAKLEAVVPKADAFQSIPGGDFQTFQVLPGRVTVLGTVRARVAPGGRDVAAKADRDTKLELIDAALARAQGPNRWGRVLNIARDSLSP